MMAAGGDRVENYTKQLKQALKQAEREAEALGYRYVGTEHILLGILSQEESMAAMVLKMQQITYASIVEMIPKMEEPALESAEPLRISARGRKLLEDAAAEAHQAEVLQIGTEHVLMAILKSPMIPAMLYLAQAGIRVPQALSMIESAVPKPGTTETAAESSDNSEDLALQSYCEDILQLAKEGKIDPVIGRERETQRVIQILLRRTKNNPCLLGEAGVGKSALVEGLAVRMVQGKVPELLRNKALLRLDLAGMIAGSKFRGEFEERVKRLLEEIADRGNVLLFIDELHTIVGAGAAEGAMDISNMLKPALARGEVQVIGATTLDEYRKYIEKDPALERRFQPVRVEEPTEEDTLLILKGLRPRYEEHHGVTIEDAALEAAVKMSGRYMNDRFWPDKAIDLMDEAAAKARLKEEQSRNALMNREQKLEQALLQGDMEAIQKLSEEPHGQERRAGKRSQRVGENEIAQVVSEWTGIPAERLSEEESQRLKKLEERLHQRVIGQEEAVQKLSKAIRRSRAGLQDPRRPIGSFLFLGPTGVGKTELTKALSEALFEDEKALIRLDMSEYMEKHTVSRLLGSPPGYVGYEEGGQLSEKVRRHPYSVVLFDEIEKAHPDIFNVLLQILDDGQITDAQGRKVDFRNTVIIMTSNVGARNIIAPARLGFAAEETEKEKYEVMRKNVMEEVKRLFRPEFLNRIDDILVFHPLSQEHIEQIVELLFAGIADRIQKATKVSEVVLTQEAKKQIARKGFDAAYGARPIRRLLQSEIEDEVAQMLLDERIQPGKRLMIEAADQKIQLKME